MARPAKIPAPSRLSRARSSSIPTSATQKRPLSTPATPPTKKPKVFTPPQHWKKQYDLISEMRSLVPAPVDTMGCAMVANPQSSPRQQRFQTLIALMLSSQTLDTVTAPTIWNMQRVLPHGLDLQDMLEIEEQDLDKLICKVGFHNKKAGYIKRVAEILRDKYNGDIPDTVEGLCSLPGVGEKMAHLCMTAAWKKTVGVGVDTHVHRIANILKWVDSSTPEKTRVELESWLPHDLWGPVNPLLVGFGQTICVPRTPKCGECKLAEEGICPFAKKGTKMWKEREGKKRTVKEEAIPKAETTDVLVSVKDENEVKAQSSPRKTMKSKVSEEETSSLKPVKEEVIAGYHLEHFS